MMVHPLTLELILTATNSSTEPAIPRLQASIETISGEPVTPRLLPVDVASLTGQALAIAVGVDWMTDAEPKTFAPVRSATLPVEMDADTVLVILANNGEPAAEPANLVILVNRGDPAADPAKFVIHALTNNGLPAAEPPIFVRLTNVGLPAAEPAKFVIQALTNNGLPAAEPVIFEMLALIWFVTIRLPLDTTTLGLLTMDADTLQAPD